VLFSFDRHDLSVIFQQRVVARIALRRRQGQDQADTLADCRNGAGSEVIFLDNCLQTGTIAAFAIHLDITRYHILGRVGIGTQAADMVPQRIDLVAQKVLLCAQFFQLSFASVKVNGIAIKVLSSAVLSIGCRS
jgi:hypothetical protein